MAQGDQSLGELFGDLLDDGKAYAQAEFELARLKVEKTALSFRTAAILALAAVGLAFTAFIALTLTIVLWLSSLLGPLGGGLLATAIVTIAAVILFLLAKAKFEAADDE
jgi:hypothetical protein